MAKRLPKPLKSNSFFLCEARGTGKSTLIKSYLGSNVEALDLLDDETLDRLLTEPKIPMDLQCPESCQNIARERTSLILMFEDGLNIGTKFSSPQSRSSQTIEVVNSELK